MIRASATVLLNVDVDGDESHARNVIDYIVEGLRGRDFGRADVSGVVTEISYREVAQCAYCRAAIAPDNYGSWIDATEGDVCWGDPETGENENEPHTPTRRSDEG